MGSPGDLDYLGFFSGDGSLVFIGRRIRSEGTNISVTTTGPQGCGDSIHTVGFTTRRSIWRTAPLDSWLVLFGRLKVCSDDVYRTNVLPNHEKCLAY